MFGSRISVWRLFFVFEKRGVKLTYLTYITLTFPKQNNLKIIQAKQARSFSFRISFQIISHISLNSEQVLKLEDVRQRQIKTMKIFAILIFGTIFLSLSASIFIAFKSNWQSNRFEVNSENEFCMEIELNAKTVLDPKVRLKIIELKRKLPRPNDGDVEKIDEKIIVCYQRVIRSESKFEF